MANSDEEKKLIEEKFEKTIEDVFEEDIWKKDEKIKSLYKKVIEKRGKAKDDCGKYGDDSTTIELMLYIRKLMREIKLIPDVPLEKCIQSKPVTIESLKKFIVHDGKTRSWLTTEYKERFPISYDSEPESHSWDYLDDGWDYSEYMKKDPSKADIEWIFKFNKKFIHIYYNELDHYLTYLVGAIRNNNTRDGSRKGVKIKEDLKNISKS